MVTTQIKKVGDVGAIVGYNEGYIYNCDIDIDFNLVDGIVGGVVGRNYTGGIIEKVNVDGEIEGTLLSGGIVGVNMGDVLEASSDIDIDNGIQTGGIVGDNKGLIYKCINEGDIVGGRVSGGIASINNYTISNCSSSGDIETTLTTGGIVGENYGLVQYSKSSSYVLGETDAGGIAGTNSNGGVIRQSYSTGEIVAIGNVEQSTIVGGVVGLNIGEVSSCYSTGLLTGNSQLYYSYIGGVGGVGQAGGKIVNSFSLSSIIGYDSFRVYVGNVIGLNDNTIVESSYGVESQNISIQEENLIDKSGTVITLEEITEQFIFEELKFNKEKFVIENGLPVLK